MSVGFILLMGCKNLFLDFTEAAPLCCDNFTLELEVLDVWIGKPHQVLPEGGEMGGGFNTICSPPAQQRKREGALPVLWLTLHPSLQTQTTEVCLLHSSV
ncbi:hypothetical protein AMECASPLE_014985 [Ameca splendens]|uniref:Uncharacterized protein n=1 Tax=Ameca splendens TaxID=208324 RepID=A0ABV1AAQ2_9TELE